MKAPIFLSLLLACGPLFAADKAAEKTPVDELLEVMRYEETSVDSAVAAFDGMIDQMVQNGVPKEAVGEIRAEARALFTKVHSNPEMRKKTAELYSKHFTEDELKEMTEFYRTPLGQKTLAAMPAIMNDAMKLGMDAVQKEMPAFQQKVGEIVEKHQKAAAPEDDKDADADKEEDAE
jgi:hypothetical protein